ncbi:MAG: 2OG-Fe(II) oxygenase family protein, partial [Porticoccaceae bacterium]|nr:2OG-Fe(II) oxygenase family protein [Porticoccaceae bacterium]
GTWEPYGNATRNGFHTSGNLFVAQSGCVPNLERIIENEIASYYAKFKSSTCLFMELWPKESSLIGWSVRLHQNGYQDSHIHPGGWLSGVVYLKPTKSKKQDQGAIEFSLCGTNFPILDEDYPKFVYCPKKGDIVLFPSSLYHRTIPFKNDEERLVVAFDLVPHANAQLVSAPSA